MKEFFILKHIEPIMTKRILLILVLFFFVPAKKIYANLYLNVNYYGNLAVHANQLNQPESYIFTILNHSIVGSNASGNLTVSIGNLDSVYNIADKDLSFVIFAPYFQYQKEDVFDFSVGFMPLIGSELYVNKVQMKSKQFFGPQLVNRAQNKIAESEKYYTVNNTFIHSDYPFAVSYVHSFNDDAFKVGVSYSPNYNFNLSLKSQNNNYINNQAFDLSTVFYDEYNNLGYGFNASIRYLIPSLGSNVTSLEKQFNTKINNSYELSLGLDLDFMGISYRLGYGKGSNYQTEGNSTNHINKIDYSALSTSIAYTIYKYMIGLYYLNSSVTYDNIAYNSSFIEVNAKYNASAFLSLNTSLYSEWLNHKNILGVLLGFTFTL